MSGRRATMEERPDATYRGYRVSILRDPDGWKGLLDDKIHAPVAFESAEEASAWLRRRIDDKIAEAIFPGLADRGDIHS